MIESRWRASKRWAPCGNMDHRLKIPRLAKVECGFWTTVYFFLFEIYSFFCPFVFFFVISHVSFNEFST